MESPDFAGSNRKPRQRRCGTASSLHRKPDDFGPDGFGDESKRLKELAGLDLDLRLITRR